MYTLTLALSKNNKKEILHRGYMNVAKCSHIYGTFSIKPCHKALPRASWTWERHNNALLVGGSHASKTGLRNREESQEPPGVTQLQNPPGREGQRRQGLEHGHHAAAGVCVCRVLRAPLPEHPCKQWAPHPEYPCKHHAPYPKHPCKDQATPGSCPPSTCPCA